MRRHKLFVSCASGVSKFWSRKQAIYVYMCEANITKQCQVPNKHDFTVFVSQMDENHQSGILHHLNGFIIFFSLRKTLKNFLKMSLREKVMFDKLNRIQLLIAYSCYKLISNAGYLNNETGSLIHIVTPLPSVSIVTVLFVKGPQADCVR